MSEQDKRMAKDDNKTISIEVDQREHATILAGLRLRQSTFV